MNTLIIYDSTFGNTAQVAQAMADKLGEHGTVRTALAAEAGLPEMKELDLLIVGGPTQRHGLSPAIRALLERLPRRTLHGAGAAAFDTRYHMAAWKSGSAANRIASRLKRTGASLLVEPESFFVAEREGPLEEGELKRAARWAEEVFKQFEASRSVKQDKAEVR
ncbi:MAG TPA: flavodoxin domain-containing protein [Ktedonobacteraceae bacterium]